MTSVSQEFLAEASWEWRRWVRSQRVFLLLIPAVAGPIGTFASLEVLRVNSPGVGQVLGLAIVGGLGALVILDLSALSVGEELSRRASLLLFVLPQGRGAPLAGRVLLLLSAALVSVLVGSGIVLALVPLVVPVTVGAAPAPFNPLHVILGLVALLAFLGGVTLVASVVTRSAASALVAGVLAAVVTASGAAYLTYQHTLMMDFPEGLALGAVLAYAWAFDEYVRLES